MENEKVTKIIIFKLNDQEYGTDINQIRSIELLEELFELPHSSKHIKGVVTIRGEVTPIIDLKIRMQMSESKVTDQTRVLVTNIKDLQVGFIVDDATDVISVEKELIEATPKMINKGDYSYLNGVAKVEEKLIFLLNLDQLLDYEEISEVKKAAE